MINRARSKLYITSRFNIQCRVNIIDTIARQWKQQENSEYIKCYLAKFYPPYVRIPKYNLYYSVGRSLICINLESVNILAIDCYSIDSDIKSCTDDFSKALRMLPNVMTYVIDLFNVERSYKTDCEYVKEAIVPGGAGTTTIGALREVLGMWLGQSWSIWSSVIYWPFAIIIYIVLYVLFKRRES